MKDYQKIITSPIQFLTIGRFEIIQELNEHAVLGISGLIDERDEEDYLEQLEQETWMLIEAEDSNGQKEVLFHGLADSFVLEHGGGGTVLSMECLSGTCLLDDVPRFRTYQQENKAYSDIIDYINGQYKDAQTAIGRQEVGPLPGLVLQNHETDWEFLKRLASRAGGFLAAACHLKGSRYYWGMPELGHHDTGTGTKYTLSKHMEEHRKKTAAGIPLFPSDSLALTFDSREICRLGDTVLIQGQDLSVSAIRTRYQGGECVHTYSLRTINGLKSVRVPCYSLAGASFTAKVIAVREDQVQVRVDEDGNEEPGNTRWFPYSTPYSSADGSGWYCMPEIGDEVRLHMPSAKEEDAYVISAVHLKSETSRQDPNCKSVKNRHGKEILFTPEALILTNNDGLRIELRDGQGIVISSSKEILISSEDKISVSSNSSSVTIAGNELVEIRQGGTSLVLRKDISFSGGEFQMQ